MCWFMEYYDWVMSVFFSFSFFFICQGSEESEEEKPLTEEEQKRTVGHQLLMKHQERLAMGNKM